MRFFVFLIFWLCVGAANATVLTVDTIADNVPGRSLRNVIATASDGDTIAFAPQLSGQTMIVIATPIDVFVSLVIDGSSLTDQLTLHGTSVVGILKVDNQMASLEVINIRFYRANRDPGINMLNGTALILRDCSFEDCGGPGFWDTRDGGAVFAYVGYFLIEDCDFTGNSAENVGGALLLSSQLADTSRIRNCIFTSNESVSGGAIQYAGETRLEVEDCEFRKNVAIANGGGMYYLGTGGDSLLITNCLFEQNVAGSGGGLSITSNAEADVFGSKFIGNRADFGGGVSLRDGYIDIHRCVFDSDTALKRGGGVIQFDAILRFYENSVKHCRAEFGGGAYFYDGWANSAKVHNNTFTACFASNSGGAIGVEGGWFEFMHNTIFNNEAMLQGGGLDLDTIFESGTTSQDIWLYANIIAGNISSDSSQDVYGNVNSLGNNIIGVEEGGVNWLPSDQRGNAQSPLNPQLATVQSCDQGIDYFPMLNPSPALGHVTDTTIFSWQGRLCYGVCGNPRYVPCIDAGAYQQSNCCNSTTDCALASGCLILDRGPELVQNGRLELFPNPSTGSFSARLTGLNYGLDYVILDLQGKVLLTGNLIPEREYKMQMHDFPKGIYLLKTLPAKGMERPIIKKILLQ